ncbi:MAG: hypothetical protein JSS81_02010 [Acidobacteria bacterium]|nr:hypothetical protein [Acidobacteriota bacterium]
MEPTEFRTGVIKAIDCYKEAWEIMKPQYWLLFAVVLVGAMIGGFTLYILFGAMACGMYYCFLRVIDGREFKFEDLFKGFRYWLPGLIVGFFIFVPLIIIYGIIYVPTLVTIARNPNIKPDQLMTVMGTSFIIDIIFSIGMVCLHTLIMFAFPLIVDRNLSGVKAMTTSARAVWANLSGVAGLFGVGFLVSLVSMMACGVGIYFSIPLVFGATALAYRKIFPALELSLDSPAPEFYRTT